MSLSRSSAFLSVLASLFACGGAMAAEEDDPVSPDMGMMVPAAPSAPRASPWGMEGAEFSLGIRAVNGNAGDSVVSASIGCFLFCVPVTAEKTVQWGDLHGGGLRADFWGGGSWINAGFGIEMMSEAANADQVSLRYNTTSFFPMLRLPLWRDAAMPGGHVNLYGGLMITRAWGGDMDVNFPELPRPVSGVVTGSGGGAFVGMAFRYRHAALSLEYRDINLKLDMKDYVDYGNTRIDGKETQVGLSYLY